MRPLSESAVARLDRDEVHLWYVHTDRVTDPELLSDYHPLMNDEEAARQRRFIFERDRHQFLVTRALVRMTLSRYFDVPPAEWQFKTNAYGRPGISYPEIGKALHFNLSHTRGMAVMGVVWDREIGVDVEDVHRREVGVGFANRYFSPAEVADLRALPTEEQPVVFFDYWTLKESYIKARGMGLSLPLDKFTFHLRPPLTPTISFAPDLIDDPQRWEFAQFRRADRFRLALTLERGGGGPARIVLREIVPGVE